MKRFTDTEKWGDPWFRKLSSPAKQLWGYLCDKCNAIGLIELDFGLVSGDCGQSITESTILELGDRVQKILPNKYFLPKFIPFQYGELSASCPPHRNIIKLVTQHRLVRVGLGYRYPNTSEDVDNQDDSYPNARVALPYRTRQDKKGQDQYSSEGGTGGISSNGIHSDFPECPPISRKEFDQLVLLRGITPEFADWFWNVNDATDWKDNRGRAITKVEPMLMASWNSAKANGSVKRHSKNSTCPPREVNEWDSKLHKYVPIKPPTV